MRLLRGCGIYPSLFIYLVTKCSERQRGKDCKKESFMPATSPGRALPSEPLSFFFTYSLPESDGGPVVLQVPLLISRAPLLSMAALTVEHLKGRSHSLFIW